MVVWCGQCQTKNDGHADCCVRCGAALKPEPRRGAQERPARPAAAARSMPRAATTPSSRPYECRRLQGLIEEQYPDRPDLRALVDKCQIAVRREAIMGGAGHRHYFLPERAGAYVAAPEDTYTFGVPGRTIVLVVVKDALRPGRKAVYYVENRPAPLAVPLAARLAHYDQLSRDERLCQLQLWLAPILVASLAIVVAVFGGLGPALRAANSPAGEQPGLPLPQQLALFVATALAIYMALHVHRLAALSAGRKRASDELAVAMGLPRLDAGPGAAAGSLVGLTLALGLIMVWFAARAVLSSATAISPWEPPVVLAFSLLLYPAASLSRRGRQWLALRQAERELASCLPEGRECSFEPWLAERG